MSLDTKNILEIIMVWGLIIGTLISYVPQYYRIYKIKNTKGINEIMLICGMFSSYTNVIGSIQENFKNLINCKGYDCYDTYIPIVQLFSPFLCAVIFYMFFLFYFNYKDKNNSSINHLYLNHTRKKEIYNVKLRAKISLITTILLFVYLVLLSVYFDNYYIDNSGKVLNVISTILSLIMWLPQIYTTYKLKNNHSLSLIALSIHAFGCLCTVIYQSVFLKQPLWVILCYIVGFISETSIVIMCLYYRRKKNNLINQLSKDLLEDKNTPIN